MVNEEQYGNAEDYYFAIQSVLQDGVPDNYFKILRTHFLCPDYTTGWVQLSKKVGYANFNAVNLHYGKLSQRIAHKLNITNKPKDTHGGEWWTWVLVRWAEDLDTETGHTAFVLRKPVIEALKKIWSNEYDESSLDFNTYVEGNSSTSLVTNYQRNKAARLKCLAHYGLSCLICNFNFAEKYGTSAEGFIHVHHLDPLSETKEEHSVDPILDLIPVCPNCHSVIHLKNPPYTMEEMRQMLLK